jgi:hypothetical protein
MININCDIIDKLTNKNLFAYGSWSYVYKYKYKKKKLAIKMQSIYNNKSYNILIKDIRNIKLEIYNLKLLSKSRYFFPIYYSDFICNKEQIIILKYYKFNFVKLIKKGITLDVFKNIIYQIIIAIYIYQKKTNCFHNDIAIENILLKKCDSSIYIDFLNKSFNTCNLNVILIGYSKSFPINYNTNIDIQQLKQILHNFIFKYINFFYAIEDLYDFCSNFNESILKKFNLIQFKSITKSMLNIRNLSKNEKKIKKQNELKYEIFKFMIDNKILFDVIKNDNIIINNLNQSMLDFIDSLPNDIEECYRICNTF